MNDQMAVRMANGGKDALEQRDARGDAELQPITIDVDGLTLNVLQHELRLYIVTDPCIDEASNVRMVESSQHPSFAAEALIPRPTEQVRVHELDGDRAFEASVRAPCSPDAAHATATDLGFDHVWPDVATAERRGCGLLGCKRRVGQERGKTLALARGQCPRDLGGDSGLRLGERRETRRELPFRQFEGLHEV